MVDDLAPSFEFRVDRTFNAYLQQPLVPPTHTLITVDCDTTDRIALLLPIAGTSPRPTLPVTVNSVSWSYSNHVRDRGQQSRGEEVRQRRTISASLQPEGFQVVS